MAALFYIIFILAGGTVAAGIADLIEFFWGWRA